MKKLLIISALAVAACRAIAGVSFGSDSAVVVVAAASEPPSVTAHLVVPADFVSVAMQVYSDEKDTALAFEEAGQAVDFICRKAKDKQFQVMRGEVSVSEQSEGRGGWRLSLGSSGDQSSGSAEIYLLVPFTDGRTNIFQAGAEAVRFIAALDMPENTHYQMGPLQLAVENPEQHRGELLRLIADDIAATRKALAVQGTFKVGGLEKPVMVGQKDDQNVELYLDYSLSIASDK